MSLYTVPFVQRKALSLATEKEQERISDLLYWLGITSKYVGYHYLSYAVLLVMRQPERLLLVTKWLYPDIAKHFLTDWRTVERGMRFSIQVAWTTRPEQLQSISQDVLDHRPSIAKFIRIVIDYLHLEVAA